MIKFLFSPRLLVLCKDSPSCLSTCLVKGKFYI